MRRPATCPAIPASNFDAGDFFECTLDSAIFHSKIVGNESVGKAHNEKGWRKLGGRGQVLRPRGRARGPHRARPGGNAHSADRATADGQNQLGAGASAPAGRQRAVRDGLRRSGECRNAGGCGCRDRIPIGGNEGRMESDQAAIRKRPAVRSRDQHSCSRHGCEDQVACQRRRRQLAAPRRPAPCCVGPW